MIILIFACFGAIFGSFASALIPRLRAGVDFKASRSECPKCHHTLGFLDLFPIFSYLFLWGKCRYCQASIPPYHFLLELTMTSAFALIAYFFVNPSLLLTFNTLHIAEILFLLYSIFVGVVFAAYDLLYMEIPDQVVIPFLCIAFVFLGVLQLNGLELSYMRLWSDPWMNGALVQGMLGMLPIFGFFLALILVSNGRWLGGGDLRIALYMGFIGWAQIAWLGLFASYIVGSIIGIGLIAAGRGRKTMIPFGPFLAIGLWIAMVFHGPILEWYYSFLI